jgi:hypothetical protein
MLSLLRLRRAPEPPVGLELEPPGCGVDRSHWFVFAFAWSCVLASLCGFLQGAWPFGLVEAVWSVVALRRWWLVSRERG